MADQTDPIASYNDTYASSTRRPQKASSCLKTWWNRYIDLKDGYRPYKVQILSRSEDKENDLINATFILAREAEETKTPRQFNLDIPGQPEMVWTSFPSTAQFANPSEYGFLFLTDAWAKGQGNKDYTVYAEGGGTGGGGKWPIANEDIRKVLLAMENKAVREALLRALNEILESI